MTRWLPDFCGCCRINVHRGAGCNPTLRFAKPLRFRSSALQVESVAGCGGFDASAPEISRLPSNQRPVRCRMQSSATDVMLWLLRYFICRSSCLSMWDCFEPHEKQSAATGVLLVYPPGRLRLDPCRETRDSPDQRAKNPPVRLRPAATATSRRN